jgi:hypothetical protein
MSDGRLQPTGDLVSAMETHHICVGLAPDGATAAVCPMILITCPCDGAIFTSRYSKAMERFRASVCCIPPPFLSLALPWGPSRCKITGDSAPPAPSVAFSERQAQIHRSFPMRRDP